MFDRQSPSITGITFLFHPTKRWKILCLIIALAVVTLSRFQCIPQVDWKIYPFPSSIFNSNWWYYPCILTLFVNKALWFKFLSDRKKIISPCFTICFAKVIPWVTMRFHEKCYAKKMFACQILPRKGNGTSSITQILLFWQKNKDDPQRVFRLERSQLRNAFFYCLIDNNGHIPLYIVFNSK